MITPPAASHPLAVPPSPTLLAQLYARYQELQSTGQLPPATGFDTFFALWATGRRCPKQPGLDDGNDRGTPHAHGEASAPAEERPAPVVRPRHALRGTIRTIVLLVDFDDCPHQAFHTPFYYRQLFFGLPGEFPTGSLREYYRTISGYNLDQGRGIDVDGAVYGWFRLPRPLSFYAAECSGMGGDFPANSSGMARDAIFTALSQGVRFAGYDSLGTGGVTALCIVHAGRGGEETGIKGDLWSVKWTIPGGGVPVGAGGPPLKAESFLTVPEDATVGVCCHEWGHLAGQWADYYDLRESPDLSHGPGGHCLMASGAWANGGLTPVLPHGMLRIYHGWAEAISVRESRSGIVLPSASDGGGAIVIHNPATMRSGQYILVEYRQRAGQDAHLPASGVAVYGVDEALPDSKGGRRLAVELLSAAGCRTRSHLFSGNPGNNNDLFPEGIPITLADDTTPPLHLPGGAPSGVALDISWPKNGEDPLVTVRM